MPIVDEKTAQTDAVLTKHCPCAEHEGPNPLPVSEFGKLRNSRDGYGYWCKKCHNRRADRWRQANPEKSQEAWRRWNQAHPGGNVAKSLRRRQVAPEKERERIRQSKQAVRDTVLDHYGRVCVCCGATERLSVDHINGDGREHRIALTGNPGGTLEVCRWLIRNNFPPGFQVLCVPCNTSKSTGSVCRLNHALNAARKAS